MKKLFTMLFLYCVILFTGCSLNKNKSPESKQTSESIEENTIKLPENKQPSTKPENNTIDSSNDEEIVMSIPTHGKLVSDTFLKKIETCAPYLEKYINPVTKKTSTREILGLEEDGCIYREQVSTTIFCECKFDANLKKAYVDYIKYLNENEGWKNMQTKIKVNLAGNHNAGKINHKTSGTSSIKVNEDVVVNPLNEALSKGLCKTVILD